MAVNKEKYTSIQSFCKQAGVTLVAVSKTKPIEDIQTLYDSGHRDFGENYVQELCDKASQLPSDIRWHFIGHLQRNKVKYIAPFVHLIHGVDSYRLLEEIGKHADKLQRNISCLLQMHIATEETKFGMDFSELQVALDSVKLARKEGKLKQVSVTGLMGMASFSDNEKQIASEFEKLASAFENLKPFLDAEPNKAVLSMGMSADYQLAIEKGSNMVRVGSLLFGSRV